jgi:putative membrane protein
MRRTLAFLSLAAFCAAPAFAQPAALGLQDQNFLNEAALLNLSELQMAKLAQERAETPDLKRFVDRLIQDHGKAMERLQGTAQGLDFRLPQEVDAHAKARLDDIASAGGAFERRFMAEQEDAHARAIKLFEAQVQSNGHPAVKQYAEATLPELRAHLEAARSLADLLAAGPQTQAPGFGASQPPAGPDGTGTADPAKP